VAINKSSFANNEEAFVASERGIEYLLSQRTTKGWQTTRDTLYNIMAFATVSFLQPSFNGIQGTISYLLNGKTIGEWNFSPSMTGVERMDIGYQLRKFLVPPETLVVGDNVLEVHCTNDTGAQLVFERDTYPPLNQVINVYQNDIGKLISTHTSHELFVGQQNKFNVQFVPSNEVEALMLEIPIPSGCNLVCPDREGTVSMEEVLSSLRSENKDFDHFEVKLIKGEQRLCCHSSRASKTIAISGAFFPTFAGSIQMNSPIAYPMYQPSVGVEGLVSNFVVKAAQ